MAGERAILFLKAHVEGHMRGGVYVHPYERRDTFTTYLPPTPGATSREGAPAELDPHEHIPHYRSGASSHGMMRGYIMAGVPFGVALTEMRPGTPAWYLMLDHGARGGEIFVDSGAFPAFTRGEAVDWTRNKAMVRQMIAEAPGARFHIVMPDVIGDQDASLALLRENADYIREVIAAGQDALVPIQKGRLSPREAYEEAVRILGTDDFTASLPSNKAAFSTADLDNLMSGPRKPQRVHFLGIAGRKEMLRDMAAVVHRHSPDTFITSDANRLRAKVGKGRAVTNDRADWETALFDSFRQLLEMQRPELVAAWDEQGRKKVSSIATSYAIFTDERAERSRRTKQGRLFK